MNWSRLKKKRKKQVEKEIKAETEMCNKEPAETREQYLTRKVQEIKDDTFVSAEVIKQYFQLNAELKNETWEQRYHKWFNDNKQLLECFFKAMKEHFIATTEHREYRLKLIVTDQYEEVVDFGGRYINLEFLVELLRRYGYKTDYCYLMTNKTHLRIYYNYEF